MPSFLNRGGGLSATATRSFHIDACLGRGGFGEVYRARMVRDGLEVDVAIKLLRGDVDPGSQAGARLRDEARLLALVRHRAVPKVYDLVTLDDRLALVSEYVEGEDLRDCLRHRPPIPPRACAEVLSDVADALHAAWTTPLRDGSGALRIVHRDLKPANVRVGRDAVPKLLDFGIAWTEAIARAAHTQTSALVGSPPYMAPERFDGAAPTPANDVYSLGCMLYECVAGRRLYDGVDFRTLAGIMLYRERFDRTLHDRLAELRGHRPLRELVAASLAWDPTGRPTADDLSARLLALADSLPGEPLKAWCRAHTWTAPRPVDSPWVGRTLVEGRQTVADTAPDDPQTDQVLALTWEQALPGGVALDTAALPPLTVGVTPAAPPPSGLPAPPLGTPDPSAVLSVAIDTSPPPRSLPPAAAPAGRGRALAGGALAALLLAGTAALRPTPAPGPAPAPVAIPASTAPPPVAAPVTPPAAAPPIAPVVPAPAVVPAATPAAHRSAPHGPSPTPRPAVGIPAGWEQTPPPPVDDAAAAARARVGSPSGAGARVDRHPASADVPVVLVGAAGVFELPAEVPAGRYEIRAAFDGVRAPAGGVVVPEGGTLTVRCDASLKLCKAR